MPQVSRHRALGDLLVPPFVADEDLALPPRFADRGLSSEPLPDARDTREPFSRPGGLSFVPIPELELQARAAAEPPA